MNKIEQMFYEAFCRICPTQADVIETQVVIGLYKVDFRLKYYVIEIDGHDYHKTKEQREYDYNRERYLQRHGYFVVRFTGTEVFLDADKCVHELADITDAYLELMRRRFPEKKSKRGTTNNGVKKSTIPATVR